ncbi:MAG: hypothetical protein JXQ65_01795 [Candidatus Marinimicrobia bacterium]|nr:hypothetical protein [Candidatus Neomarinimicrobiota bacterium]
MLNIQSSSTTATLHTDISYHSGVGSMVTLNEFEINRWKSGDRGNFVAKFLSDEVKGLDNLVIDGVTEILPADKKIVIQKRQ